MKPCAFEYFAPRTVQEAIALLAKHDAKILAGGQSLVPIMNFRLGRPEALVDINGIKELEYIREEGEELVIGALTRQRDAEISTVVREKCPLLVEAISHVGHVTIRNRGTVGGSVAHADPSAEIPTAICALDGAIKAMGPAGETTFKPEEFFLTYLTTALDPTQVLTEIRVPVLPAGTGWSFVEMSRRLGDFAIVAVATVLLMDHNGTCREARIAVGGVAPTPVRATAAEEVLAGRKITQQLIAKAAQLAIESTDAESDYHASADYRKEMTKVLVQRSLREALERTQGGK
jgi:aerobic carbon-monoxide dehydrogenase medium subunit